MKNMQLRNQILGMVETNTYFIKNKTNRQLLIVDPADSPGKIYQEVDALEGVPVAILLTHGHFDHMMAAEEVREAYGIPVLAAEAEKMLLTEPQLNLTARFPQTVCIEADRYLVDGEVLDLAGFEIKVMVTPGHTSGSTCYYFPEEAVLISGDTLFAGSCGRTDFETGSMLQMKKSLKRLTEELPEETEVFPGHGEFTTIAYEKRNNPFV